MKSIYPFSKRFPDLALGHDLLPSQDGIEYKGYILYYHQFLRRRFQWRVNEDFIGSFVRYFDENSSANQFRIAIDHRRIVSKEYFNRIVEFDTWFGPRFDKSRLDDPYATGLTIVKCTVPDELRSLFYYGWDHTEFFWSYRDGIKTFQIEEISEENYAFDSYHLNRYVHSEREVGGKRLRHFDGAVKIYLGDRYRERVSSMMPDEPRAHKKVKLFRIDGDIDVDRWINLIAMFFKANVMVIEYFDPETYKELIAPPGRA